MPPAGPAWGRLEPIRRPIIALSVIGTGIGRPSTLSIKTALDMTAVGPSCHMETVIAHPERNSLWLAAAEGEAIDWDGWFNGFGSAVDWSAC